MFEFDIWFKTQSTNSFKCEDFLIHVMRVVVWPIRILDSDNHLRILSHSWYLVLGFIRRYLAAGHHVLARRPGDSKTLLQSR